MVRRIPTVAFVAVALLLASALTTPEASAGPLDPPAGPVAATGPTVITALPYTISQPGSYVLNSNLQGSAANFLTIAASHVFLDLRGFRMSGSMNASAIQISGSLTDVVISNGALTGWGGGISGPSATFCRVENVWHQVTATFGFGPAVELGADSVVRSCRVVGKITVGDRGMVEDTSGFGGTASILGGKWCVVTKCRVANIEGQGSPVTLGDGSILSQCAIQVLNGTPGPAIGVSLGDGCSMSECTVQSVGQGLAKAISAGAGCLIERSTIKFPGTAIAVTGGSTVRDCTIDQTGPGGIGTAITVLGTGNRIEGNQVRVPAASNGISLDAAATNNIVIRNSVTGPTSLVNAFGNTANNTFGAVLDRRGQPVAAGTDPWANFLY